MAKSRSGAGLVCLSMLLVAEGCREQTAPASARAEEARLDAVRRAGGNPFRATQRSEPENAARSDASASAHIPSCKKMCAGMWRAWLDSGATLA